MIMPLYKNMKNKLTLLILSAMLGAYPYANSLQEPLLQIHDEASDPLPNLPTGPDFH